jgi:hypothetical protein
MQKLAIISVFAAVALLTASIAAAATATRTVKGPTSVRGEGSLRADLTRSSGARAVALHTDGDGL